jgi:cytochrome c-type biogenesis protein CcmH
MTRLLLLALVAALGSASLTLGAPLSGEALDRKVLELADELRCPTCQSISVRDSEAAFSRQIRDKVRSMLEEGKSDEEIRAYFVSRYGEWILRAPKKEGVGLVLWVLPGLAMLAAGGMLFWRLRRNTTEASRPGAQGAGESLSESDRAMLERDLRRFEQGT